MNKRRPKRRNKRIPEAFKILIEKHADGYVAYPLGRKGVVVGQGDSYEQAMADVKSAIRFHIETFGKEKSDVDSPVLESVPKAPLLRYSGGEGLG
jgi:predicted RNase H-like HicB family nuclease